MFKKPTNLDGFMKLLSFLLIMISLLLGCSSSESDNGAYTKSNLVENRLIKNVKHPWAVIDNEGSDLALTNKNTNSFFMFNSACRKYDPSNLPTLTNSMLTGINNVEFLEKSTVIHQEREGVLVIAKGAVDGIERFFRILTTQKNNCIYDLALISTSKANLDKDTADYNKFIQLLILN